MNEWRAVVMIARATARRRRRSLLVVALGAALFHAIVAVSFPAIGGMEAVTSVVQTFPEGLRQLLKLAPNLQAGFGLVDYLAFTWIHPLFIGMGAAFVVDRAAEGLAGEIETGSIYLVLSRPVPRRAHVAGKFLELSSGALFICLAAWVGLFLGAQTLAVTVPTAPYLLVAVVAWVLFTALGAGALFIASFFGRSGIAGGLGAAWTIIAFVLDVVPFTANSWLGAINPWHYYFPQEIVSSGNFEPGTWTVLGVWIIFGVVGATYVYSRRDLV